ncbi:MAG: hypothetical protein RLZZ602_317 [Pseudomonadota bacterium]|jgi:DNA-binding GntR family transcriptional regulator
MQGQEHDASKLKREPLYKKIADDLLTSVRDGVFPVGTLLPGELELIERYKSSRHTVREALRVLEDMGIVRRQRGRGTLVISPVARPAYVQMVRSPSELLSYPSDSSLRLIAEASVKADAHLSGLLHCAVNTPWHRMSGVRTFATGVPVCWTDIYVIPEYQKISRHMSNSRRPVYDLIAATFGEDISKITIEIYASVLEGQRAQALDVPEGTLSLSLCRRYYGSEGRLFEVSISEHPASNFSYTLEFNRGWQSAEHWTWSKS